MARDPRRHVILDANILSIYLSSKTSHDQTVIDRVKLLIDAVSIYSWPILRLHIPEISLIECQGVLDKYRFCDWYGPCKSDPSKILTATEYSDATSQLALLLANRFIEVSAADPALIATASLTSIVNQNFSIPIASDNANGNGNQPSRKPMGGADCLIAGIGTMMCHKIGYESVVIATADNRMSDVLNICKNLSEKTAKELGLISIAKSVGLKWSPRLYPSCINLSTANIDELKLAFLGWPTPSRAITSKTPGQLTPRQISVLWTLFQAVKSETSVGADSLPYSHELDDLQTRFGHYTGVYLTKQEMSKLLLGWRKKPTDKKPPLIEL